MFTFYYWKSYEILITKPPLQLYSINGIQVNEGTCSKYNESNKDTLKCFLTLRCVALLRATVFLNPYKQNIKLKKHERWKNDKGADIMCVVLEVWESSGWSEHKEREGSYKTDGRLCQHNKQEFKTDHVLDRYWKAGSYLPLRMFLDVQRCGCVMGGEDKTERGEVK